MTLWNAEGLKPIGYIVWPLRSLKVRNPFFTLTWPGDLTFGDLGLKFLHKVSNSIVSRYRKNGGAARRRFPAIREKTEGWSFLPPSPSNARVNRWANACVYSWPDLDPTGSGECSLHSITEPILQSRFINGQNYLNAWCITLVPLIQGVFK